MRSVSSLILFGSITITLPAAAPTPAPQPDPLPKGATARLGSLLYRGPYSHGLTYSADGKRLLALADRELVVWDAETGTRLASKLAPPPGLPPHKTSIVATVTADRVVWLSQARKNGTQEAEAIVTDHEGKILSRFPIDPRTLLDVYRPEPDTFGVTAVSPDSRYLSVVVKDAGLTVVTYDLASGEQLHARKFEHKAGPKVLISKDCKTLFVSRADGPTIRCDVRTGNELPSLEGARSFNLVATSPNGKWVVGVRSKTRTLDSWWSPELEFLDAYDTATGKLVGRLDAQAAPIHLAFAGPDGLIVTTEKSRPPGRHLYSLSRWNLETLKRDWELPMPLTSGPPGRFAISPDGSQFGILCAQCIFVHDSKSGKLAPGIRGHGGSVGWVAFSEDGKTVTTAGGSEVITWSVNGEETNRTEVPELRTALFPVPWIMSPSRGDHLAWFGHSSDTHVTAEFVVWDREKNVIGWKARGATRNTVERWATDGKSAFTVRTGTDRNLEVVTTTGPSGERSHTWTVPPRPKGVPVARQLAELSDDGHHLAVVWGAECIVYNTGSGKEVGRANIILPPDARPSLALSSDGARVVIQNRKAVAAYDTKSGKLVAEQPLPDEAYHYLKVSPDGKRVALWFPPGGARSSTVQIWDLTSSPGTLRNLTAEPEAIVLSVAFSPDGTRLAAGYTNGTALIWDLTAK